jgi:hypothetical protein
MVNTHGFGLLAVDASVSFLPFAVQWVRELFTSHVGTLQLVYTCGALRLAPGSP